MALISEVVRYVIFTYLVLVLAYSKRDPALYHQNKFIKQVTMSIDGIHLNSIEDTWEYFHSVVNNGLFAEHLEGYFNSESSFFTVTPRLRQFRSESSRRCTSKVATQHVRCFDKTSFDRRFYDAEWTLPSLNQSFPNIPEWLFNRKTDYPEHTGKTGMWRRVSYF